MSRKATPHPDTHRFSPADLDRFDDEALRTFLDPADGGVRPSLAGLALQGRPVLATRVRAALPPEARAGFDSGLGTPADPRAVARAGQSLVRQLFWPLLYWCAPDLYLDLIAGEDLPEKLMEALPIDGRTIADLGAGAGRFAIPAARRALRVIAVDAIPALLERLESRARAAGVGNLEARRGSFRSLPITDRSVDAAVYCSSLHDRGPHGGPGAIDEAERIVRPGGWIAVVWPESSGWLLKRGFSLLTTAAEPRVRFPDLETAERLCREFYGAGAARWVRQHRTCEVPAAVVGRPAVGIACIRRVPRPDGGTPPAGSGSGTPH